MKQEIAVARDTKGTNQRKNGGDRKKAERGSEATTEIVSEVSKKGTLEARDQKHSTGVTELSSVEIVREGLVGKENISDGNVKALVDGERTTAPIGRKKVASRRALVEGKAKKGGLIGLQTGKVLRADAIGGGRLSKKKVSTPRPQAPSKTKQRTQIMAANVTVAKS